MGHRRRSRRKLTAYVVGATLVVAGGVSAPMALASPHGGGSGSSSSGEQQDFAFAAHESKVPESVLMAVAYEESQWDVHQGHNTSGGYGPMSLTDVTPSMVGGGEAGAAGRADLASLAADPSLHTLTAGAKLIGAPAQQVRTDRRDNVRAAAALLASYEKDLQGGTPTDPADWYAAVAKYSGSTDQAAAESFANRVFATMKAGAARTTADGQHVDLASQPSLRADTGRVASLHLKKTTSSGTDCPVNLDCQLAPAATTNYQVANRPADGMKVDYIVIHDTETSYQTAIDAFQNPASGDAANYVMRSSDGAVTQSVADKDLAFHAGNYWFNMHSVGVEHEGFAAHGASWYTQVQYQNTADLVKYLARKYHVTLDREHIIGHDNVPGPVDSLVSGMHWDPGPYWDWNRFMAMLGAPTDAGRHGVGPVGTAVTIAPEFASDDQTVSVCPADDPTGATTSCTDQTAPSNFLFVRSAPGATAPLAGDPYVHANAAPGTDEINDWSATVSAGQQFVVADQQGDWTAIWYGGQKVWFDNPDGANTVRAKHVKIVQPTGATAPLFGEAYPDASEYPAGLAPDSAPALSKYAFPSGQAYVATQQPVQRDDFYPANGTTRPTETYIPGAGTVYTIQYNHRLALVNSSDVAVG
ncbi:N-acetylmuramoyl-L-alanine amidase [Actinacidiphila yanglinensis]|uniref:N-acetylmuramoyl-L-alanine amidase n=1 Tax=Actinacidiphila yanglinensis TaxID=310779 RepID=A0A1H6DD77_9ACTN|nr:N-acetylmuramoyl-L-alanine amidase [Actinacidiphila yanglinensis]SEG83417.1 N-acetylmuramoyl-L-alanine amidase [Actinacidiphila yanglinensis]